jgi:hypothetical protein
MDPDLPAPLLAAAHMNSSRNMAGAGLVSGPLAWAISTQGNYILPAWQCAWGVNPVPWLALALVMVSAGGAGLSLVAYKSIATPSAGYNKERRDRFICILATFVAVIFCLAIALQGLAGLIFTGCER